MATYKNYPILQNADTIAAIPAYTTSLVDTLAAMLGNADYQTWDTAGSLSGWEWDLTFRKLGRIVFLESRSFRRTTGSSTTYLTLFTIPAAFRPGFQVVGPAAATFSGTAALFQVQINTDGTLAAKNTAVNANAIRWALPGTWLTAG